MDSELVLLVRDWGVEAAAATTVARALSVLMAGDSATPAEAFIDLRWRSLNQRRPLVEVASTVTSAVA